MVANQQQDLNAVLDIYGQEIEQLKASQGVGYNQAISGFSQQQKQNLVEWQLDFRTELEDIEHLLRSDIIVIDEKGNEVWKPNPDKDEIVFNDVGVNAILREIRLLVNKNKVLSNYDLDEIRLRVQLMGNELRSFIYNSYEHFGIDTAYKEDSYPTIVLLITDMIEASYRRALNGEERRDLNSARIVQQNDPMMHQMPMGYMGGYNQPPKSKSIWKPWTWIN